MARPSTAIRRTIPWGVVTAVAVLGLAVPADGAATKTVALYSMNEKPGATVLIDSSGRGHDGVIGATVKSGKVIGGATAHRFPYLKPNTPPAVPSHLDRVADTTDLDPETADFAITIRYRTHKKFGNVVQKGQSHTPGGYYKLQAPKGKISCLFRGAAGSKSVNSGIALNDGKWHTIRCERTATKVVMTIDGTKKRTANGATGSISNKKPLTIGGKSQCDQITVTCDYFVGDIDYIRFEKG